jgi:hypothetical protein
VRGEGKQFYHLSCMCAITHARNEPRHLILYLAGFSEIENTNMVEHAFAVATIESSNEIVCMTMVQC